LKQNESSIYQSESFLTLGGACLAKVQEGLVKFQKKKKKNALFLLNIKKRKMEKRNESNLYLSLPLVFSSTN
jgi:hypothetical protein